MALYTLSKPTQQDLSNLPSFSTAGSGAPSGPSVVLGGSPGASVVSNYPTGAQVQNAVSSLSPNFSSSATDSSSSNLMVPIQQAINFNPSDFNVPDITPMIQKAYDALAPYYNQILQQNNYDLNLSIQSIQAQQDLTTRQAAESAALTQQQTTANLQASLQQLGIKFPQETEQLAGQLNQRGMAVTMDSNGNMIPVTQGGSGSMTMNPQAGGEGGIEMGQLSQDQQLRREALNRSAQQTIQSAQLSQQQRTQQAQQTAQSGITSQNIANTQQQQQLQQTREQQALSMAQMQQTQQEAQQQANINKQILQAQYGSGGGGGGLASGDPKNMTQSQRQGLWTQYGHSGTAPVGYGGG